MPEIAEREAIATSVASRYFVRLGFGWGGCVLVGRSESVRVPREMGRGEVAAHAVNTRAQRRGWDRGIRSVRLWQGASLSVGYLSLYCVQCWFEPLRTRWVRH